MGTLRRTWIRRSIVIVTFTTLAIAFNNCDANFQGTTEAIKAVLSAGSGIAINDDAPITNSDDVFLTLRNASAKEMYVTNTADCSDGGAWEPMARLKPWKLAQKNQFASVYVKYREVRADVHSECVNDSIIHDDIPPVVKIVKSVGAFTNSNTATVDFEATDSGTGVASVNCQLDGTSTLAGCASPWAQHALPEGSHWVEMIAFDNAGNRSLPKRVSFVVDRTPPTLTLNSSPSKITNKAMSEFSFSAIDLLSGVESYECQIGTGAWSSCSSPFIVTLAEGPQTFGVRAYDKAGNVASLSYTWTIDSTAPTVTITKGPALIGNSPNATFEFVGTDGGKAITMFECSVDGKAAVACASPYAITGLAAGSHKFEVVGIDAAGNRSSPAMYSWLIDLTIPTVQFTQTPPKFSNTINANFYFTATDNESGIMRIECQVDGGAYVACSSPHALTNLAEGDHSFTIRAYDNAGNVSAPLTYTWKIDATKPTVEITAGPMGYVATNSAELMFVGTDAGSGIMRYECALDTGVYTTCSSPKLYASLAEGNHVFLVRVYDNAGNVSDPKSRSWSVDMTGPAINFEKMPAASIQTYETALVQYSVTDSGSGVMTVTCGLNGNLVSCREADSYSWTNMAIGSYTFTVKASDKLGNASTNSISWTVRQDTIAKTQLVTVNENNKIDVLVVIDNSGSMSYEQANMAQRFGGFLDQLSGLDWQVGIVTTDVSSDAPKKDGRFLELSGMTGQFILKSTMDYASAKTAFAATIQRPSNEGSGNEQGVAASVRAIQRSLAPTVAVNAPNAAFFRSDSVLAMIVVTDADETNPSGTQNQNKPQYLIDLVKSSFGASKTFAYHSIIVKPGDTACVRINGNENYGYNYDALSKLTGGVIGSVCEADYTNQLKTIGMKTIELVRSATLDCMPLDTTGDGKPDVMITTADMSAPPGYVVEGMKITFDRALPAGGNTLKYTCLK